MKRPYEHYPELGRKSAGSADDPDDVNNQIKRISGELKTFAENASKEIKAAGDLSTETKQKVDELLAKQSELQAELLEVTQRLNRRGGAGSADEHKSMGQQVVESEALKAAAKSWGRGSRISIDVKAVTSLPDSAGQAVAPDRLPGILALPRRRLTVRDLVTPGRTSVNAIEYVRETGFTNNAGPVSEGVRKPESEITFDAVATTVKTIAHYIKASKQILDDFTQLQSFVDGRLRWGLAYVEEQQLLRGSGTGNNLHGIIPLASPYAAPFALPGATPIDTLRLALLQAELAQYPSNGIVLNPIDWTRIELTKTVDGAYIFAQPQSLQTPVLWGRPVVSTQAMDEAEFLVGAFQLGAQIFDREQSNVVVATENEDDFVKNMITIRNEERLAFAVYRPEAFVTGDLGVAT